MRTIVLLLLTIALCPAALARALDPAVLAEANRSFEQGAAQMETAPAEAHALLENAVAGYNAALEDHDNGHLRYNLANAYALLGDTGRAAANYRRAERLLGADRDVRANAAQLGVGRTVEPSFLARLESAALYWRGLIPVRAVFWTGVVAAGVFWLALGHAVARSSKRAALAVAGVACVVALLTLGSLGYEAARESAAPEVVVLQPVVGRKGPDDRAYEPSFAESLAPGMPARIVEDRGAWVRLRLRDGRDTWTPSSAVERL